MKTIYLRGNVVSNLNIRWHFIHGAKTLVHPRINYSPPSQLRLPSSPLNAALPLKPPSRNPSHGGSDRVGAVLRAQEDGGRRHLLQAGPRPDQDQRRPHRARGARDPPLQGLRAHPPPRPPPLRRRRHEDPGQGRRPHLPDLRHPPEHRQGPRRVLPEVRGRAEQEGDQGHLGQVRQDSARGRSQAVRAQEVRWSRCPRQVPEELPLMGNSNRNRAGVSRALLVLVLRNCKTRGFTLVLMLLRFMLIEIVVQF